LAALALGIATTIGIVAVVTIISRHVLVKHGPGPWSRPQAHVRPTPPSRGRGLRGSSGSAGASPRSHHLALFGGRAVPVDRGCREGVRARWPRARDGRIAGGPCDLLPQRGSVPERVCRKFLILFEPRLTESPSPRIEFAALFYKTGAKRTQALSLRDARILGFLGAAFGRFLYGGLSKVCLSWQARPNEGKGCVDRHWKPRDVGRWPRSTGRRTVRRNPAPPFQGERFVQAGHCPGIIVAASSAETGKWRAELLS